MSLILPKVHADGITLFVRVWIATCSGNSCDRRSRFDVKIKAVQFTICTDNHDFCRIGLHTHEWQQGDRFSVSKKTIEGQELRTFRLDSTLTVHYARNIVLS